MSLADYALAVAWLAALAAVLATASRRGRRALCPGWAGPPAWLADAILAVAILVVASELAGLLGGLTRTGVMAGVVGMAVATSFAALRARPAAALQPPPAPAPGRRARAAAIGASLVVAAIWAEPTLQGLEVGMYRQDSTWYHLPFSAHFFQTGHTGELLFTDPLRLTAWFYPQTSELIHGVGMVALGRDLLSPALNMAWMGLALLAAWTAGRPSGNAPVVTIGVSALLGTNMMTAQAGSAPSDMPALFFLLAAVALLLNARGAAMAGPGGHGPRLSPGAGEPAAGPLFVAALAAGLAAGTKVTMIAPVAALTVAVIASAPSGRRLAAGSLWLCGAMSAGGFWYVRNLAHSGSPLPFVDLGPLPAPQQLPLYPRPPGSIFDYLDSPHVWVEWFTPGLKGVLGPLWPLLLAGAAVGLAIGLRKDQDAYVRAIAAAGIAAAVVYALIPITAPGPEGIPYGFSSNLRYLAPAILAGLLALLLGAANRGVAPGWPAAGLGLVFASIVIDSGSWPPEKAAASLLLATGLVLGPVAVAAAVRRGRPRLAAGLVAAAALLLAVLGHGELREQRNTRYLASLMPESDNPGFRAAEQWRPIQDWARRLSGKRIGVIGPSAAFGQYIFYGTDLSNRVRYIGQPGPHGAYRPIDNCQGWRWAINAGGFDYVVITPDSAVGPTAEAQETYWTRTDPAARPVISAPPAAVFEIVGKLSPESCAGQASVAIQPVPWGGIVVQSGSLGGPALPGLPGGPFGVFPPAGSQGGGQPPR